MCELLCISREDYCLKECERKKSSDFYFIKRIMDFEKTLSLFVDRFNTNKINYALIGGFAQGLYGISRTTFDIDFIVDYDKKKLKNIFSDFYKVFYENSWVLQIVSENKLYGGVDIIFAKKELSKKIIMDAKDISVFDGRLKIKVARLEDIIGLKLQAIKNDPKRYIKERFDIESIMEMNGKKLDWDRLRIYFEIFRQIDDFKELRKRYER